ncbi:MAG: geranylgeranylglycerol-phosphate geranylgeranyltransferase [Candidatus Bathyarchaeota archaeon]|nr:geranylgeranylglycerol-phosphate geranylgeranyltransferase [Candidatus Bathyarchaeota archaeon A05DMB-3]MDH7606358.1 geranylgeranylglycerol-phosphate geranylgeranyltransferase [Candidatus Bathyarchaeota archaeon]
MKKLAGYLRLMRPINCLMMGFAVIVGAALANSNTLGSHWQNLVYGFLTGFLLTAASMVINDYYDREIDAINEPSRPIPSGLVKPKEALTFAILLTFLGLTASLLTSVKAIALCFATALIFWLVSASYVTVGKRTGLLGNLLVSACVSAPFIYGSLAVANEVKGNIWIFVSMVFLSNTGREITKGIVDVQGDKAQNVKTVAVRHGERTAALAASALYLLAVVLTPLPPLLNFVSVWFIPLVIITDVGLIASSIRLLRDYSRENARKVKNQILAWFLIGLIAFLVGSLS